jgi:hypothetical protein
VLSVAVFAGLSGRPGLIGRLFVGLLESLSESLNWCTNGFAREKRAQKEKLNCAKLELVSSALKGR